MIEFSIKPDAKLNKTHIWILSFLSGKDFTGPEQIGKAYGASIGKPYLHSSWASPKCKKLVTLDLLERSEKGHYRLKAVSADSTKEKGSR